MTLYSKMELYYTALLNAVQTNYNENYLSNAKRPITVITFLVLQCVINPRNSRLTVICTVVCIPSLDTLYNG